MLFDAFVTGKAATNVGYLNPSFGVSMTDEEFREIQRISQVPFDCDSSSEKVCVLLYYGKHLKFR